MSSQSLVDDWLDRWEALQESGQAAPLDQFIKQHCQGAPRELIEKFLERVRALLSMNRRIKAAGGTGGGPTGPPVGPQGVMAGLKPGYEPIPAHYLETRLGQGGFGEVWKAAAPGGFHVALKFVRLDRPVREAELRALETIKEIRHPHLLSVFGAYQKDGYLIIAMELADRTLEQRYREARAQGLPGIPKEELLEYFTEAAKGLDYLNEPRHPSPDKKLTSIQHRDIKPQNLLLSGGSIKVGDFGLARCLEHSLVSHTGSLTAAYAAPEFFKGQTSSQSDQYSLAVTYCHLRGGRLPFTGNAAELMAGHLNREPDLSMLPAEERPLVARALAKEPRERWPSCGEFVKALRQGHTGRAAEVQPRVEARGPSSLATWVGQWKWRLGGGVAALLVLCVALLLFRAYLRQGAAPNGFPNDGGTPDRVTLAVLDFENHSKDPALDGFRQGLRDMLVTDLSRVSKIKVVERARLDAVLDEHKLTLGGFIDPRTAAGLGKGLGARSLLTGSYVISGDDVRVDVRMIAVETGEIQLADAVTGTKGDFFRLQRGLAEKVLAGLQVEPNAQERQALERAQTGDFEVFRLYSDALLAQKQNRPKQAETMLRQALARNPQFQLAQAQLAAIEAAAQQRLAEIEREQLARLGAVGQALSPHQDTHQRTVEARKLDPNYFASLAILSAHAGLRGDAEHERRLLVRFWAEFTGNVQPEQVSRYADGMRQVITREGKFFQEQIDSGSYPLPAEYLADPEACREKWLKPELRDTLKWPEYARFWPFDPALRAAFRVVQEKQGKGIDPSFFESRLPYFPHEYLQNLLKAGVVGVSRSDLTEEARLRMSVIRYHAAMKQKPAGLSKTLRWINERVLAELGFTGPEDWNASFVLEAVGILEVLASECADANQKREIEETLLRYVRQARLNAGEGASPQTPLPKTVHSTARFCGVELKGPRIVFLVDTTRATNDVATDYVFQQVADAVRSVPPTARINVCLFGCRLPRTGSIWLFGEPQEATDDTRRKAIEFIRRTKPKPPVDQNPFGPVDLGARIPVELAWGLDWVLKQWPESKAGVGEVCVASLEEHAFVPDEFLLAVQKRSVAGARVHLVCETATPDLLKLPKAGRGAAVVLDFKGGRITPKPVKLTPPK